MEDSETYGKEIITQNSEAGKAALEAYNKIPEIHRTILPTLLEQEKECRVKETQFLIELEQLYKKYDVRFEADHTDQSDEIATEHALELLSLKFIFKHGEMVVVDGFAMDSDNLDKFRKNRPPLIGMKVVTKGDKDEY